MIRDENLQTGTNSAINYDRMLNETASGGNPDGHFPVALYTLLAGWVVSLFM
jgi:hypothetical protein